MTSSEQDGLEHAVVINHDEQYSIWRTDLPVPAGWIEVGVRGSRDACLDYIEAHWTDMRPLRVRWQLEEFERARAAS